jgi:hypothetical protein
MRTPSRIHNALRGVLVAALVVACSTDTGTTTEPSSPLAHVTAEQLSLVVDRFAPVEGEFEAARALLAGQPSRDDVEEHVATYYSPTFVFEDVSFGDRLEGREALVGVWHSFFTAFGGASIHDDLHVGDPTALHSVSYWDFSVGSIEFTESTPFIEVSLVTVDDGYLASQTLFLDLETLGRIFGVESPVVEGVLQREYAEAWNSGSSERIVALFHPEAVRRGLSGVDVEGVPAIRREVEHWLTSAPGANWTVKVAFAETSGRRAGAIYDVTARGCTVEVGMVFEVDEDGAIAREFVHYDAESLRACEWIGR